MTGARRAPLRRAAGPVARLLRCAAGVAAVEFALVAPVLVIGAFSTADAGMAVHERMMIGQALRAGAERVMAGADDSAIRATLAAVASENFTVAWSCGDPLADTLADTLRLCVESYLACPDADFAPPLVGSICISGEAPQPIYRLSASTRFSGVMLPEFPISDTIEVLAQ